jgi:hypothetical protein
MSPSNKDRINFLGFITPLLVSWFLAGCSKPPSPSITSESNLADVRNPDPWFEETADKSGLHFQHSSGHTTRFLMPEMETGGVGLLDYDGDGYLDVFCVNGGSLDPAVTNKPGHKLYRNLGNWKFEDVTERAGVGGQAQYGMGCACADYNEDGFVDIYATGLERNILYRNNGDGTFTDVTSEARVGGGSWGTSCAFFDYDGDGHLDLFVANYIKWSIQTEISCYSRGGLPDYCSPLNYKSPAMDTLYHNKGDGTFADMTVAAGLDKAYGNGLGVVCADFNRDGRPDIYVANDAMPNQLWINQGNGRFTDEGMIRGCAVNSLGMAEAGMGVVAMDINEDGWLDLFITHLVGEGNRLFVNTNGVFVDTIKPKGPGAHSLPLTGFGVGFVDFDNDGELDAYVANGRVKSGQRQLDPQNPYAEPNTLVRGMGSGDFEEVKNAGTAKSLLATSRGAAFGDLDNDGGVDVVVINRDGPVHLLRNIAAKRGGWIMFRVLNRKGNDAIGAMVRVDAGGRSRWRQVQPNEGYCSSNDPRLHFGLGTLERVDRITVRWPNGKEEAFGPFETKHLYLVREGAGR